MTPNGKPSVKAWIFELKKNIIMTLTSFLAIIIFMMLLVLSSLTVFGMDFHKIKIYTQINEKTLGLFMTVSQSR